MSDHTYDDLDPLYRAIWGQSLHHAYWESGKETSDEAKEKLIQKIFRHWQPSGHVIDIGCGYGILARRLSQRFQCHVSACTSSQAQADAIKKNSAIRQSPPANKLTLLSGSWLDQALPAQSLDAALSLESTSHFADFSALLKKTHQVLKPGASWLICDWFSEHGERPLLRHLAETGGLPPWRSLSAFLTLAHQQGFTTSLTLDLSRQVAPTWSSLFLKSLSTPLKKPKMIPLFLSAVCKRPALLWTFPLLRLAYAQGDLSYFLIKLTKDESLSSRPPL